MYLHKYSPLWRWFGLINLSHDSSSLVVLTHITFVDRRRTSQTLCRKTFAKTMGTTSDEWHQGVQSNSTTCIVNKNNVLSSRRTGAFKPFRVLYGLETRPFSNIFFAFCYVFWNIKLILLQYTYLHFDTPSRDIVLRQPGLVIFTFCPVFRSPYNSTSR